MEVIAKAKHIKHSVYKGRKVADLIRGKDIEVALAILSSLPNKAGGLIKKVVLSAAANAENNFKLKKDNLYIYKALIDQEGPLKRVSPRGMGRADIIRKPMCQITVVLKEKEA